MSMRREAEFGYSLVKECAGQEVPTKEENIELVKRAQNGDKDAITELCLRNGKLITYIINKTYPAAMQNDDIFQQGMLGILIAIKKFDVSTGYSFTTYAYNWIHQKITRYMQDTGRVIRIPVHMYPQIAKFKQLQIDYMNEHETYPSDEWLAKKMKISVKKVKEMHQYVDSILSLDESYAKDSDDNCSLADIIADANVNVEKEATQAVLNEELYNCMKIHLSEREMDVLAMRYGLTGKPPMTLSVVGEKFGVTRERIRQIEAKALKSLRVSSVERKLKDYLLA